MAASRDEVDPGRVARRRDLPRHTATAVAPPVHIQWPERTPAAVRRELDDLLESLPLRAARRIRVRFLPDPHAWRNQLFSGGEKGQQVHAATYIRQREMVLAAELLRNRSELRRIFLHEVFHFAWVRAGNRPRRSWQELMEAELAAGARGELGWSAEWRKDRIRERGKKGRLWRDYLCESFCDTAAWVYAGIDRHEEFTLGSKHRQRRAGWFRKLLAAETLPV
jgi:hypothetical protein